MSFEIFARVSMTTPLPVSEKLIFHANALTRLVVPWYEYSRAVHGLPARPHGPRLRRIGPQPERHRI